MLESQKQTSSRYIRSDTYSTKRGTKMDFEGSKRSGISEQKKLNSIYSGKNKFKGKMQKNQKCFRPEAKENVERMTPTAESCDEVRRLFGSSGLAPRK